MSQRVFYDPRGLEHRVPTGFPECPERLVVTEEALLRHGWLLEAPEPVPDLARSLRSVHSARYLDRLASAVDEGARRIDTEDNPVSPGTFAAARAAVETAICATRAALEGAPAFALARPPGHHCEHDRAMGFCYLNQIAVAARWAQEEGGVERVAIVDFDVHHGNGTQHLFETDATVLYVSSHQWPFYPGTGAASERGRGPGEGTTLNLPLPAGSDDERYRDAFADALWPALERFSPDLLLVSAGFDSWQRDPLGGMRVTDEGFREWGGRLRESAERLCDGRMASVLEGGYDLRVLGDLIHGYLAGVDGASP